MYRLTHRGATLLFVCLSLLSGQAVYADLTLNASPTVATMRTVLDGPGLALLNLKVTKGIKGQYGVFSGGDTLAGTDPIITIPDGLFMSTGNVDSILGPNSKKDYTYNTGAQYSDPNLISLSANAIYDPVILEFDIVPEGDLLNFLLVFGSEEYPEYVCSKFNDVFGLFVSGPGISGTQNAAYIPDTQKAITVNNVNAGQPGIVQDGTPCTLSNTAYFIDNGNGSGKTGTQLDGFTTPLTASLSGLTANQTYHVKMALADAGDQAYDSAAFFKWLTSTSSQLVDLSLTGTASTLKPDKGGLLDLTYTVTNHSARATRLVEVNIELPSGITLQSDDSASMFDASTGDWQVGTVAANSSRTLKLRTKVGTDYSYRIPAEITYAFNKDPDSTPYNRLAKPDEDDTAILSFYTISNSPPVITNNGGAATYSMTILENSTGNLLDYNATDKEGEKEGTGLVWSLGGGADDALFSIDASGLLVMKSPPDFEKPLDKGTDNNYEVLIKVCDSYNACAAQALTVTVNDVQEDRDGDGLNDADEIKLGSNPDLADTDGDGVDDKTEVGSNLIKPLDTDGDGLIDVLDTDDDNDTIPTRNENYNGGTPANDDTDGDGIPDYRDNDDDGDGIVTRLENYNGGTPADNDTDKDGKPDYLDKDDDGDGKLSSAEGNDPNGDHSPADARDTDGDKVPDYLDKDDLHDPKKDNDNDGLLNGEESTLGSNPDDADTDRDGVPDGEEVGASVTKPLDTDLDGIPNILDPDDDNDGVFTVYENYNSTTPAGNDTDKDGKPDYLDTDDDGDGKPSSTEANDPNGDHNPMDARDTDGDKIPDYLDLADTLRPEDDTDGDGLTNGDEVLIGSNPEDRDTDKDGIFDGQEVGVSVTVPLDTDKDGIPNILDPDDDNDGLLTSTENYNGGSPADDDFDKDGTPDYLDKDDDNDSVLTVNENYNGGTPANDDTDKDGKPDYLDTDDDGDGIITWYENYNGGTPENDDTDKDGTPDYLDIDDDGDSIDTRNEQPDPNGNGNPDDGLDSDKDGIKDYIDADDDNDGLSTLTEEPDPNGDGNPSDASDADFDNIPDYLDPEITPFVRVQIKTLLQGPYNRSTGLMTSNLNSLGYLPVNQPYQSLNASFGYTSSPDSVSPFSYSGKETLSATVKAGAGDKSLIDWMLIEIRDTANPAKRVAMFAGMLLSNGDIVNAATGASTLIIHGVQPGNYYLALAHRNHMGIMTATPVALSTTVSAYDFTKETTATYGYAARVINNSVAMMRGGDINNSNTLITEGQGSDKNIMLGALLIARDNVGVNSSFILNGYYATDINLDGASVYAGPNNDVNTMILNVFMHPGNVDEDGRSNANYVVNGTVPKFE